MAFDTFVKVDKIPGSSTDSKFSGQIEILSFSLGASNPVTISSASTGSGGGKVSLSSFNLMKKTDKASPLLFDACCKGTHIATVDVNMRKAGGTQFVYLTYNFTICFVESIQWSGSSGGDDVPTESVSIAYGKLVMNYSDQDAATGQAAAGSPIIASWDQTKNLDS